MNNFPQRKSIRLKGYDYSQNGYYFITVCTKNRECLFGNISDGKMVLNNYGNIAYSEIINTNNVRPNVEIKNHIVMPNHIHIIIAIVGAYCIRPNDTQITKSDNQNKIDIADVCNASLRSPSQSVGSIIRGIKGSISKQCGFSVFQHSYHDHIIHNEKSYQKIYEYVENNSLRWELDCHNPQNPKYKYWSENI